MMMKNMLKLISAALFAAALFVSCQKELDYYTVTLDYNHGDNYPDVEITVAAGEWLYYYYPEPPENYVFDGWYREPEGINAWNFESDAVTGDMTLYARWKRFYTFTFHGNGGASYQAGGETWIVEHQMEGNRLFVPENVIRPGYLLEGWYRDAGLTDPWDFDTDVVTGDASLYAKWTEGIKGLTKENYPMVDGATSTRALNVMVACKLLGLPYTWESVPDTYERCVVPNGEVLDGSGMFINRHVKTSQTHGAMLNLINREADIILRSTTASPDEKAAAEAAGVRLIETPIALDAFVFLKNYANPVRSLTLEQIRKIYTRQITDWSQIGWNKAHIRAFARPRNSGSEEAFRQLVMKDVEPAEFPEENTTFSMIGLMWAIEADVHGIGYIFKNYKDKIVGRGDPEFAINDVLPTPATMKDRTYPLTTEVYAIIRSDLDPSSMAYRLYEWLQTESAGMVLNECGFTALE